jgi:uncharacterized OsmC-like protein
MHDIIDTPRVNGLDLGALADTVAAITADPSQAQVAFRVRTHWAGQTRSETMVEGYALGGQDIARSFRIVADEPIELLGGNSAPNPQELLMAAVNACMMVGYVANAALRGVTLESCEIATEGSLDLRGFLGLSDAVPPGYEVLRYTVTMRGDGTPEQYREIHEAVQKTSPNYFNITRPVRMEGALRHD